MKKLKKQSIGLIGAGIMGGVGATAIEGAGGDSSAMTTMGGFFPVMGTVVGAGATMRMMGNMPKPKKKKSKW